jgi:bifunctional DNA-binding transcriptional regulator/antitoxin component of YhaV-PrlF toxin-antitoxin module
MTATQPKTQKATEGKVYRAKVTGRHAITLPAELCRQLGIEVGDSVEIRQTAGRATMRRVPSDGAPPAPPARGILREEFEDWEDIQQFVAEERAAWGDDPESKEPKRDLRS